MHQKLTLDSRGYLINSDDKIFDTSSLKRKPVTEWSFFIESLFPTFLELGKSDVEHLSFEVESDMSFLKGFFLYNFRYLRKPDGEFSIEWHISDRSHEMDEIKRTQQLFNETEIKKQKRMFNH